LHPGALLTQGASLLVAVMAEVNFPSDTSLEAELTETAGVPPASLRAIPLRAKWPAASRQGSGQPGTTRVNPLFGSPAFSSMRLKGMPLAGFPLIHLLRLSRGWLCSDSRTRVEEVVTWIERPFAGSTAHALE